MEHMFLEVVNYQFEYAGKAECGMRYSSFFFSVI